MAISYIIKINSVLMPKVKSYKVSYEQLYSDADRNLAGNLITTHIGTFPKIKLEFATTTKTEMSTILDALNNGRFTVDWYDIDGDTRGSGDFYASSFDVSLYDKTRELYEPFSVNLIAFNKL